MNNKLGAIILAAGQGKRMQMTNVNKVTLHIAQKPIIVHIVDFINNLKIETIVVVIGHYKESVIESLKEKNIIYAEQKEVLGSAHAVMTALTSLPKDITDVMVVYGDDAVLYSNKNKSIISKALDLHQNNHNAITLLTITIDNPFGLGRIVRGIDGKISSIVEEKDATYKEREIQEINPGCFIFSVEFLKKYLPMVQKSKITGEYYLTSLIDLAVKNNEAVDTLQGGKLTWRGVNTKEELKQAEELYYGK
jgi:bifunctional UDP-N-acetylglucosamine pyrophosphorylase/glucosamine-1-phosphate N-acetyltransferase